MMIYITTTNDLAKNQKNITSLTRPDDILYILYTENNASIPIKAYQILSGLKCKVEFKPSPNSTEDQFRFVYELGMICGENKNTLIRPLIDTNIPFLSIFQKEKAVRKRKSNEPKAKKQEAEEFMPAPEISVQEIGTAPAENAPEKKRRRRKTKESSEDAAFDKVYEELMGLFEEVKTKSFNPADNLYGIIKATKAAIADKIALKESFKVWFPNQTEKYIKAFEGKEDRLIEIVKNLNDEVK